jgi:hypothetical protein
MVTAFTVLDVYVDGLDNYAVDTDMSVLPTSNITVRGTVSGTTLNVTAISPPDACLLRTMPITGGGLPAGTTITVDIGVPNSANNLGNYTISSSATISTPTTFTARLPMFYLPHPCPRLTVINCTGGRFVTDMAGAPPDIPAYSYFRRAFAGLPLNTYFPAANIPLTGNLMTWTINVVRPYTGSASSFVLNISMFGYKTTGGNTYPTFVNQTINLKLAGTRTITASNVSGGLTGDRIVALPFWLSGGHWVSIGPTAGTGDTLANMPRLIMTAQTDQGVDYASITLNTATVGVNEISDTAPNTAI